jgi:predicted TIM-barrel fold metal-dependent hydrolase
MRGGYRVLDTDRHVVEPRDLWERHLPKALRGHGPRWLDDRWPAMEVAGRPMVDGGPDVLRMIEASGDLGPAREAGFSAESHLADMDREGVDAAVLFPTAGLYVASGDHLQDDLAAALCRAYNEWLAGYCRTDARRLKGLALVPLQDVDAAVREIAHAAGELGLAGVVVRPNPVRRRQLSDPAYWPLYAEAQKLGLALWVHGGPGTILPEIGVRDLTGAEHPEGVTRFEGVFPRSVISPPFELMGAMISLAGHEPLMEFPDLKVVFAGGGCGWLHFWADRMDDDYFNRGEDAVTRLKPGHYVARQTSVVARADENMLPDLAGEFRDNLVWGSEYPTTESNGFGTALDAVIGGPLPDAFKKKLLFDNAARLLRLS